MKHKFLILFLILGFQTAFSQLCGKGYFVLEIQYTEEYKPLQYEMLVVEKSGGKIERVVGFVEKEELSDLGEIEKLNEENTPSYLRENLNQKIDSNRLVFKTTETNYLPILIKFLNHKKEIYLLGYFFGGCRESVSVLLSENPTILRDDWRPIKK